MNPKRKILSIIIGTFYLFSCTKDKPEPIIPEPTPIASFTVDKETVIAGDTLHFQNTSTNDSVFIWYLPDGREISEENFSYPINETIKDDSLLFKLKVYSKSLKLVDSIQKYIRIVPSSTIQFGTTIIHPLLITQRNYNNNWCISIDYYPDGKYPPPYFSPIISVAICFEGQSIPITYSPYLAQSSWNLSGNLAQLTISQRNCLDFCGDYYTSLSGNIYTSKHNEIIHLHFSNLDTQVKHYDGTLYSNVLVSGDIYCPF